MAEQQEFYIPSHFDELEELLDPQFRKPITLAQLGAFACGLQVLEDLMLDLQVGTTIATAEGVNLEQWGDYINEPRLSLEDPEYRQVLRGKIRALKSGGNLIEILAVFKVLLGADFGLYTTAFPAAYTVTAAPRNESLTQAMTERVVRIMDLMRTAGFGADYVELPPIEGFLLDSSEMDGPGMGRVLNGPVVLNPGPARLLSAFDTGFDPGFS